MGTTGRLSKPSLKFHPYGIASDGNRCIASIGTENRYFSFGSGAVGDLKTVSGSLLIGPDLGDDSGSFVASLRIADGEYPDGELPLLASRIRFFRTAADWATVVPMI